MRSHICQWLPPWDEMTHSRSVFPTGVAKTKMAVIDLVWDSVKRGLS